MRKKSLIAGLLAICFILALASCGGKAAEITLRGETTKFNVGDEFTTSGLLVTVNDENVTSNAVIDSSQVDTSKPGTYVVLVSYDGAVKPYFVTVSEPSNTETLKKIEVDTTKARTTYNIGETFTSEGLALVATYSNSTKSEDTVRYLTDLSDFTIVIRDNENTTVSATFETAGSYSVFVTQGTVRASFQIRVILGPENVKDAVALGISNKDLVRGGTSFMEGYTSDEYQAQRQSYEYGDDYLKVEYTFENQAYSEHYSVTRDSYGAVNSVSGFRINEDAGNNDVKLSTILGLDTTGLNINGIQYGVFSLQHKYYGAEGLVAGLYELAVENRNSDLIQKFSEYYEINGDVKYAYEFQFGYVRDEGQEITSFNVVNVKFTLGENNIIDTLTVVCNTYSDSESLNKKEFILTPRGEPDNMVFYDENGNFKGLTEEYAATDCVARLKSTAVPGPYSITINITQEAGERVIENEYSEDKIFLADYDLKANIELEQDNDVTIIRTAAERTTSDRQVRITLSNFSPATALEFDRIFVKYGSTTSTLILNGYFNISYSSSEKIFYIRAYKVGEYDISLVAGKLEKKFKLIVDYRDPITFESQIYLPNTNPNLASFLKTPTTSTFVGKTIYFNALPDSIGGPEFTATCNSENATIAPTTVIAIGKVTPAYSFTTLVAGTYELTLTSARNTNMSCILTVTVEEIPNISEKLTGSYNITDVQGQTGTVTFTPNLDDPTDEAIVGTVTVSLGEYEGTYSFTYSNGSFSNMAQEGTTDYDVRISLKLDDSYNILLSFSFESGASTNTDIQLQRVVE